LWINETFAVLRFAESCVDLRGLALEQPRNKRGTTQVPTGLLPQVGLIGPEHTHAEEGWRLKRRREEAALPLAARR
jgi:hypothetical protein